MVGTLFHEAAHQFVSLATNASGWLNEGLACFFEGTRILPNGTVIMNMPANHRLIPLTDRMDHGWMADERDGIDANDPNKVPEKAPTFRIVLENRYTWGPPWYPPTWGVVYFLYNYQDPVDGRFIYRDAFSVFIDKSGGRVGEGAVKNFEEVVLANPSKPLKGVEPLEGARSASLPQNVEALNGVWKAWMVELRDRQLGKSEETPPYQSWGRYAAANKQYEIAKEHYEKGLVARPDDIELVMEFADLLTEHFDNPDRGAKLVLEAIHYMENLPEPDEKAIRAAERLLERLDPNRKTLGKLMEDMEATSRGILQRYLAADRPMMAMDVAWRLSTTLELSELLSFYEEGLWTSGKSLQIWDLAYNEQNLDGWAAQGTDPAFTAADTFLDAEFGEFAEDDYNYQILTLDKVTSGDFSMQADVQAEKGKVNYCGFVFGHKSAQTFHGLMLFPGKSVAAGVAQTGFVDLMSSYGGGATKTWRHVPVETTPEDGRSSAGLWHSLRLDVSGRLVDIWFDGTLLATHEFPSLDVLRGGFGLVCGRGKTRFRNVRYLARDARDPAGKLERDVRMQTIKAQGGGAVGGSYQGVVPPWPKVKRWVQGKRASWDEIGNVPQLLLLFSTQQNDMVRIDTWLTDLAKRMQEIDLQVVCIASVNDNDKIAAYLKDHPLPGAIAVDDRQGVGIGESFEQFHIRRFNLPRLLLLDLDHTVAWEGDPGFSMGSEWSGEESFLAAPLDDLIEKRKLKQLGAWKRAWTETAQPALHAGDPAGAVKALLESRQFDARFVPDAGRAQNSLGALEAAFDALESTAATFQRDAADPALEVLIQWAPLFERKLTPRDMKTLKPFLDNKLTKNWSATVKACERFVKRRGEVDEKAAELLALLSRFDGLFVRRLEEAFVAAREAGDEEALLKLASEAAEMPRLWLAREYFGW
jgi:tetratricopeptide (TPR) repeat protein